MCRSGCAAAPSLASAHLEAGVLSAEAESGCLPDHTEARLTHRGQPEVTAAPLSARGREVEAERGRAVARVLGAGGVGAALEVSGLMSTLGSEATLGHWSV